MKGNVIVGQSGGPTAVINSSLAGAFCAAKELGIDRIANACSAVKIYKPPFVIIDFGTAKIFEKNKN